MTKSTSVTNLACSTPCLHTLIIAPTLIFWATHICSSFFPTCFLYSYYSQTINSGLGFTIIIMGLPILTLSLSMFHHLNHLDHPSRLTSFNFVTSFLLTTIAFILITGN